jgi:hypothetical protein
MWEEVVGASIEVLSQNLTRGAEVDLVRVEAKIRTGYLPNTGELA